MQHQPVRRLVHVVSLLAAVTATAWGAAFDVVAVGSFKRIMHSGEAPGERRVVELPQAPGTWGVGALARMEGEIVLRDGRLLVSRGTDTDGGTSTPRAADEAALFVAARVNDWVDVAVPDDMSQADFEAFVLAQGRARGLDADSPWPFRVEGRFPQLTWHVVTGLASAGAHGAAPRGHANRHAGMTVFQEPGAQGQLIGMHSGVRLEGVATHPGERFHVHFADAELTRSGHVDAYAVARGAVLKLPAR
jgi:alpha-acetolactate decarboxylase